MNPVDTRLSPGTFMLAATKNKRMSVIAYQQVVETALTTFKKNALKDYLAEYEGFKKRMATLNGFKDLQTFQNIDNPLEILDVVKWDELKDAQRADEQVQENPDFQKVFAGMEELNLFEHALVHHEVQSEDIGEDTFLELYVYDFKEGNVDEQLELKREFMLMLQEEVEGFQYYVSMQSAKDPLKQIDLYFFRKTGDAADEHKRILATSINAKFEATMAKLHLYKTFQPLIVDRQKLDLSKADKTYYTAKKEAHLVELSERGFLTIEGKGAPESELFNQSIEAIYPVAYTVKNHYQTLGRDFVVPKMEAYWWSDSDKPFEELEREEWSWKIQVPMPEFVTEKVTLASIEKAFEKKNAARIKEVKWSVEEATKAVQILHLGSYDHEEESIASIMTYIKEHGLEISGNHKEVYLTDPRKTEEGRLRTIIRYAVG